jgi:hypothetical protein
MRLLAAGLIVAALAVPAAATESIVCASDDKAVSIDLLVGSGLDVVSIARATIEAGGKIWATDATGERKIAVGQAFENAEKLIVDFTDEGVAAIVASLRLFKASESDNFVEGGTLRLAGVGAWAITCPEP